MSCATEQVELLLEEKMLKTIVKRAEALTKAEDKRIDEVSELAYTQGGEDLGWSSSEWFVLGLIDGEIVSLLGILYREVRVGEQVIPVGGVGGVCTHPAWQRRGYAEEVLKQAAEYMKMTMKVPFGLLVCSESLAPYYHKLGWQLIDGPMVFDFQGTKRVFDEKTMILNLSGREWPAGVVDLCGSPW